LGECRDLNPENVTVLDEVLYSLDAITVPGEFCFQSDGDDDGDGILNDEDKCPCHPNGPDKGTCVKSVGSVIMSYEDSGDLITCDVEADCLAFGGTCQKVQGDYNGNGIGDVCEGYADFNDSGDINLIDLLNLILYYGKTEFIT